MTLFGKPADREDGRLKSQNNHLWVLDASFFYRSREGNKVKRQNREGETVRKESKKGHQSCKISPGMASLGEGMC